jgi:hypothetical protein
LLSPLHLSFRPQRCIGRIGVVGSDDPARVNAGSIASREHRREMLGGVSPVDNSDGRESEGRVTGKCPRGAEAKDARADDED